MGEYFAGCVSGMVGLAVGHPIDTIKVQQQNEGIKMMKCIRNIYKVDGIQGYFRGLSFPLVASGALNSIFFGIYGSTLNYIVEYRQYSHQHVHAKFAAAAVTNKKTENRGKEEGSTNCSKASYLDIYAAGCAGGIVQLGLACPVDLIKVKLQAHGFRLGSPTECVRMILRDRGIAGLYQGIGIMSIRDVPAFGLYITMYELFSDQLKNLSDGVNINFGGSASAHLSNSVLAFFAGGFSGTISWWSIIPLDVIKSRIQADNPNKPKYNGILDCAQKVFKELGFKGFFRGFLPLSVRAFPVNGAVFVTYEWLQFLWTLVMGPRKQDV